MFLAPLIFAEVAILHALPRFCHLVSSDIPSMLKCLQHKTLAGEHAVQYYTALVSMGRYCCLAVL